MNEEGHSPDWDREAGDVAHFRVRKDDATAWRTTFLILGGVVSLLGFFWVVTNGISEGLRVEIRNERNERINQHDKLSQQFYECCRRR